MGQRVTGPVSDGTLGARAAWQAASDFVVDRLHAAHNERGQHPHFRASHRSNRSVVNGGKAEATPSKRASGPSRRCRATSINEAR